MTETTPGGAYLTPDGFWVNANGKRIPPPNKKVEKIEVEKKTPSEFAGQDLKALPVAKLRMLAAEQGITGVESKTKAQLIELLEKAYEVEE